MRIVVSEAKRVGRYIERLHEDITSLDPQTLLSSDIAKSPDKVMEVLLNLPAHMILELFTFMQANLAKSVQEEDPEAGREIFTQLDLYLLSLESFVSDLRRRARAVMEEG